MPLLVLRLPPKHRHRRRRRGNKRHRGASCPCQARGHCWWVAWYPWGAPWAAAWPKSAPISPTRHAANPNFTAFFPLFPGVPPAAGQTSGKNGGVSSSNFLMAASTLLLQERHTLNGILNGLSESKALSNWSFVEASSAAARRIARRPAVFDRSWSHVPHIGQNRGFPVGSSSATGASATLESATGCSRCAPVVLAFGPSEGHTSDTGAAAADPPSASPGVYRAALTDSRSSA